MKVNSREETFIDVELDYDSQQALRWLFERTSNFPAMLLPLAEAVGWERPNNRPIVEMKAAKLA
jgi:hypothetical protein|tara:strand:- start:6843 stop:7034 length:192 start_codon:yes stop_codon:yes gene_type:complete